MQILYGVAGEGLGHAMRTQAVATHLVAQGHDVRVLAAGRAAEALRPHLPSVHAIEGMELAISGNKIDRAGTALANLKRAVSGLRHNLGVWQEVVAAPRQLQAEVTMQRAVGAETLYEMGQPLRLVPDAQPGRFQPDLVISDFETWTWLCAKTQGIPVVTLDNCQAVNRCHHPKEIRRGQRAAFEIARAIVKAKSPGADHYIITTFFKTEVVKKRTTLVPPILRQNVLRMTPTDGAHIVVYQSAEGWTDLPQVLKKLPQVEFRVYGYRRDLTADLRDDNVLYRPLSEHGFLQDLASSRGVIASAGFTLMSEALWLQKPMLAVPLSGQFEQIMNARWLDHLGYGLCADKLSRKEVLRLLERSDACQHKLRRHRQHGNAEAFEVLERVMRKLG